ncbi:YtxH domain-containing protein [Pelosinus propionicus]|uniref:Gas vesicle protein n=1 Tax=Pelosinus propionicus DSM 13327 TaxID=1123291 RepID=A0A1I4KAX7_9FIRM|nr:YtxH domain-containing protein [Pelosinus propionicus]SFL75829.1 Gas vesicle protein [Pelosinus propionicus DSM 13327]
MSILDLLQKGKRNREKRVRQKVAIGATLGMTIGAVAGVLLAPKAGKETRAGLAKNAKNVTETIKEISAKTQDLVAETKGRLSEKSHDIMSDVKEKISDIKKEKNEDLPAK